MTRRPLAFLLLLSLSTTPVLAAESSTESIDQQVWGVVSATVAANDIDGMAAVYHPDAVLVHPTGTVPIREQLAKWGDGMQRLEQSGANAQVAFRFKSRFDDGETAFETGLFRYAETDAEGNERPAVVPFEALLVRKDGAWLMLMERQLPAVGEAEWQALGEDRAAD